MAGVPLEAAEMALLRQGLGIAIFTVLALAGTVWARSWLCAWPCARWPGWSRRPWRSPRCPWTWATTASPPASRPQTPTRAPRPARWVRPSTSCSTTSTPRLSVRAATDRRMRRFVTDASHELRTPLAAIQGYAELTRQDSAELPEITEYSLARIESEARRMSSLVSDLLLLARLDEGQDLHVEDVDLADLLLTAVNDARASAPAHTWLAEVPDTAVRRARRPGAAAPAGGEPALQRPGAHPGRQHRDRPAARRSRRACPCS